MTTPGVVAAVIAVLVMGVGGFTTRIDSWYRDLNKSRLNPPNWLFGPAWAVILSLAAWSAALAWSVSPDAAARTRILAAFGCNIVAHLLWSPLFFRWKRPDWALFEVPLLWLSVLGSMVAVAPASRMAALLLAPYLIWVAFAAYLNFMVVKLNPPFNGRDSKRPLRRLQPPISGNHGR